MAARHNNGNNTTSQQLAKPVLHDFLGMKPDESPVVLAPKAAADVRLSEASPSSASVSVGGARGPFSTSSEIGSERHIGNHLEGVPFYGPRSDFSGTEISNRLVGSKRSNSDSIFMGSSRDAFQVVPDSFQTSHLMKIIRNAGGGERHRRSNEDEMFLGMQPMKTTSGSQILQHPSRSKIDANKWERSILMNIGPSVQHPPRGGQLAPFVHQMGSNKIRDANAGPSFISQPAADEGSRTGIKGPGILSSIITTSAAAEKTPSTVLLGGSRTRPVTNIIDLELTPPSRQGLTSVSRQMTIFYGGQAHVFDDVHPNKADIIMALAGSNGGSWSTAYTPKSTAKPVNDNSNLLNGDNETGVLSNMPFGPELHGRLSITGRSSHAVRSGDGASTPAGAHQGSIIAKETKKPAQAADPSSEDGRTQ